MFENTIKIYAGTIVSGTARKNDDYYRKGGGGSVIISVNDENDGRPRGVSLCVE